MFFPERIRSIKATDRVLDVGPGGTPHPRADVLLEYAFDNPLEAEAQRGYAPPMKTRQRTVYYKGGRFPFETGEFDYVICSHVVEHVPDLAEFVAEINRVGKAGYYEYPTIYYDYLYNFPEHVQFVKHRDGILLWMRKDETSLAEFKPVQRLFYESFVKRHFELVDVLKPLFFEGFEWNSPIQTRHTNHILELVHDDPVVPDAPTGAGRGIVAICRRLLNVAGKRFRPVSR